MPASEGESAAPSDDDSDLQQIPGTRVWMRTPAGAQPASGHLGYAWSNEAAIIITEIPGPYAEVSAGFTAENLTTQGMTLLGVEALTVSGKQAKLFEVSQETSGARFRKWILVCGDESSTVLINALYNPELADRYAEPLRAALLSVDWRPDAAADPRVSLDWTIEAPEGLRPLEQGAAALLFNESGQPKPDDHGAPLYIAAPSMGHVEVAEIEAFAQALVRDLAQIRDLEIEVSQPFVGAPLEGWEIVARAKDEATGLELMVHHVLLVREGGYIRLAGLVNASQAELWLPRFRAAAGSWSLKSAAAESGG